MLETSEDGFQPRRGKLAWVSIAGWLRDSNGNKSPYIFHPATIENAAMQLACEVDSTDLTGLATFRFLDSFHNELIQSFTAVLDFDVDLEIAGLA